MKKSIETVDGTPVIHTVNGVDTMTTPVLVREIRTYTPAANGINVELGNDILATIKSSRKLWTQGTFRQVWSLAGGRFGDYSAAISKYTGEAQPTCGTAMCFAGWSGELTAANWVVDSRMAVDLSVPQHGLQWQTEEYVAVTITEWKRWVKASCESAHDSGILRWDMLDANVSMLLRKRGFNGRTHVLVHVQDYAHMQLGLIHGDVYELFGSMNTLPDIERIWGVYVAHGPTPTIESYLEALPAARATYEQADSAEAFLDSWVEGGSHTTCLAKDRVGA